jgi:D-beta-D-heptose 7-phosphate kinase/D-beta-D-heptose 1-phosphate adenosyltransferase
MNKTIVLITGGFDPIHSGHISYIEAAKKLGDILVVGVNSDEWLVRKKGKAFLPSLERTTIIRAMRAVDFVITFDDKDDTAKNAIQMVRQSYPQSKIIFANGGDRTKDNIPEMEFVDSNLEFVFGVGGEDKKNSSSWILKKWEIVNSVK